MADRVILHVGPNKTGTTALQHAFVANSALLARFQIAYPMTGRVLAAHHGIADACRSGDAEALCNLSDEIRYESTALLSSELFAALEPHELERLRRAFGGTSVEVVYSLRRLSDLWPSHWKEMVKHGLHLSFPEYMLRPPENDRSTFRAPPRPSCQLSALAQVFGRENLRLAVYDTRYASDSGFGLGFARDMLGFGEQAGRFVTSKRNRTPSDWQIEALRHMNLRAVGKLDAAGKRLVARKALSLLNTDPPEWVAPFKTVFQRAETVGLSGRSPAVASEQANVLRGFRDRLIDPVDAYMANSETTVRTLEAMSVGAEINAEMDALFHRLSREFATAGPRR